MACENALTMPQSCCRRSGATTCSRPKASRTQAPLRRIRGPIGHVFNVQGASGGKTCYLNLGAHYDFLPCKGDAFVPPAKIEESHCVFRTHIEPPPGAAFGWVYGPDAASAEENVSLIVSESWTIPNEPRSSASRGWRRRRRCARGNPKAEGLDEDDAGAVRSKRSRLQS